MLRFPRCIACWRMNNRSPMYNRYRIQPDASRSGLDTLRLRFASERASERALKRRIACSPARPTRNFKSFRFPEVPQSHRRRPAVVAAAFFTALRGTSSCEHNRPFVAFATGVMDWEGEGELRTRNFCPRTGSRRGTKRD